MGKRSHRRSTGQDENNVGCVWGLIRMLYFCRDPKFLLDTKQVSRRHTFREITADGRTLAHEARNEAAEFRLMWGYEMPPHVLAQWIATRAQICTQHAYMRPYGIGQFYYLTCVLAYWGVVKPAIIFFFLYVLKDLIGLGANGF